MILFKVLNKKFVKDGASQFQNFHVNSHKFHAIFSTRFSQVRYPITRFAQEGFRKCSWVRTKRRECLRLLETFFRTIPQKWRWISQSRHTSNSLWNPGFICECWNQRAVKAVDAHIFTKQAENFKQTSACQKADGNCFREQERSADGGIHATGAT
jgi:hypothetical protein